MKENIKVLISEDDANFRSKVNEVFPSYSIDAIFTEKNGAKVIAEAEKYNPDLVVMDLFMPCADAICVISKIRKSKKISPEFVIMTNFVSQTLEREAVNIGAAYFLIRPFDTKTLAERIIFISNFEEKNSKIQISINSNSSEVKVTDILHQIGVPAHVKGYRYLRNSIVASIQNPDIVNAMTRQLYPMVAKKYKTTSSRVERAMRHAIEIAWGRGDVDVLNSYFGYTVHSAKGKPTNSEFIALISDRLRLQQRSGISA
jgi:two-component system response regulator (stage 0 sporulation protein A)